MTFNFKESVENSMSILDFKIVDEALKTNYSFNMAWEIARKEAMDKLVLAKIIYTMRRKYNIQDFDFELLLEGFDEDRMFEND